MQGGGLTSRQIASWIPWSLLTVLSLLALPASAQVNDVERLLAEGIELRVQGHDSAALDRFREAVGLAPDSLRARGHLALALHAQAAWVESERVMLGVLEATADDWVTRHADELRESLRAVQSHLAWLEIDNPGPGELWLDDKLIATLPMREPVRVEAKKSAIILRFPGRTPAQKSVDFTAGQHVRLALLEPSNDNREIQPKPMPMPVSALRLAEPSRMSKTKVLGAGLIGVGAVSLAAGIAFGVNAFVLRRDRNKECTDSLECTANGIAIDARSRQSAQFADISFIVGVAGVGLGAALSW